MTARLPLDDDGNVRLIGDFAPDLLAIQRQAPPPLPRVLLGSMVLLFVLLLLWSVFGKLDIVATAQGRLVPRDYVKIVQPVEAGVLREILVRDGDAVKAGQVLMRMDSSLHDADGRALDNDIAVRQLQLRRIDAELAGSTLQRHPDDPDEPFRRTLALMQARVQTQQDALQQERALLEKAANELMADQARQRKLTESLVVLEKSVQAFSRLGNEGFFSALAVDDKRREFDEKRRDLQSQEATVRSLQSAVQASHKRLAHLQSRYVSELHAERADTDAQLRRLTEERSKNRHRAQTLTLRAPQDGIVKDLATHTIGTVVSPGSLLLSLVPNHDPLLAEVYVRNEDAGFVRAGQTVMIKIAAYPFQKYGLLKGQVRHVGADASPPPAAGAAGSSADNPALPGLAYKALVELDRQSLLAEGRGLKLVPGMLVDADIQLGQRTVMEYLLSPVSKAWQEAARER